VSRDQTAFDSTASGLDGFRTRRQLRPRCRAHASFEHVLFFFSTSVDASPSSLSAATSRGFLSVVWGDFCAPPVWFAAKNRDLGSGVFAWVACEQPRVEKCRHRYRRRPATAAAAAITITVVIYAASITAATHRVLR
jgi:hypothetical protein